MTRRRGRLSCTGVVAVVLVACGSSESSPVADPGGEPPPEVDSPPVIESPASPRDEPEPEPEPAPAPAPKYPKSEQSWSWYHVVPGRKRMGFIDQWAANVAEAPSDTGSRRYVADRKDGAATVRREELTESGAVRTVAWSVPLPEVPAEAEGETGQLLVMDGIGRTDVLVVARRTGGYVVRRLSEDGDQRWRTSINDPDPARAEPAALQVGFKREHLLIYNRRASGPYLDELDEDRGEVLARTVFEPAVLHERFEWPPPGGIEGQRLGHSWSADGGGTYVVQRKGRALVIEHRGTDGTSAWSTTLDAQGGRWWSAAAVREQGDVVAIVAYNGASSGAVAYGVGRRDGVLRFNASPGSIGSIGHSKYSNAVAVTVDSAGHVLAYGRESGGRYIGVLDVDAGRLLGCEVWRD